MRRTSAHARWCIGLAEDAEAGIRTFDQLAWLDRLDAEHDNLAAALTLGRDATTRKPGLRLIGALILPWWFRGRGRDARRWVETFLASATGPPAVLAKVLTWSGLLADFGGGTRRAGGFEEELELADRRQRSGRGHRHRARRRAGRRVRPIAAQSDAHTTGARRASRSTERRLPALIDSAIAAFDEHRRPLRGRPDPDHAGRRLASRPAISTGAHAPPSQPVTMPSDCGDRFVSGRAEWIEGLLADAAGDVERGVPAHRTGASVPRRARHGP